MKSLLFKTSLFVVCIAFLFSCASEPEKKQELKPVKEVTPTPPAPTPQPEVVQVAEPEPPKTIHELYDFGTTGRYTIQVESGRKTENADKALAKWKALGFSNAYVTTFPPKDSTDTDTWYRLRLGRFTSKKVAKEAAKAVSEQFRVEAWVDNTKPEIPMEQ